MMAVSLSPAGNSLVSGVKLLNSGSVFLSAPGLSSHGFLSAAMARPGSLVTDKA